MRRRQGDGPFWSFMKIVSIPGIVLSVFLMIWLRASITSLEYRISELETRKIEAANKKKELLVARSEMLSVRNVELVAMERLGLRFPDRKKVIYVKRDDHPYNLRADYTLPSK
ncbi:MAG: hypothetical protein ACM34I_04265 [bacterium]